MTKDSKNQSNIRDIDCETVMRQLFDYLDDEVNATASAEIKHHLHDCRSCFSRVEFEDALKGRVREAGLDKAPDSLRNRLDTLIQGFCEVAPSDGKQEK